MNRRAFTILEVTLAAAIGGLIVVAALGLFSAMNATDRRLQIRLEQQSELERVHLVMERALGSILVSDQSPPNEATERPAESNVPGAPLPPRISLSIARSPGQMERRPDASGAVTAVTPQRLEIVMLQSPVPSGDQSGRIDRWIRAAERLKDRPASREEEETDDPAGTPVAAVPVDPATAIAEEAAAPEAAVRAVRGAFEWRPQIRSAQAAAAGDRRQAWELWWIPLPRLTDAGLPAEAIEDPRPYRIASDIAYGRWLAFSDRERMPVYATAYRLELPAYFELEVETMSGLYANWMFEVGWATGPETIRPPVEPPEAGSENQANQSDVDRSRGRARPGARPQSSRVTEPTEGGGK